MPGSKQALWWLAVAAGAVALLAVMLVREHGSQRSRWAIFTVGDAQIGARLFYRQKGCAHCHSVNGVGGKLGPDLGDARSGRGSLAGLLSAIWNHTPAMWERIASEKVAYPEIGKQEMVDIFAFLYAARDIDGPGDESNGRRLFEADGCARCHSNGGLGPDLAAMPGIDTPVRWAQAMWNHAPAMEANAERQGLSWPKFHDREMNDLLAYVRHSSKPGDAPAPGNPDRGWAVFQSKSCIVCHSVNGRGGHSGPALDAGAESSMTLARFAGLMWNHSGGMWRAPEMRNVPRPVFQDQEMADLIAFLASLRYFEPAGSPAIGRTVFAERECAGCHGPAAEGGREGPALRGRGEPITAATLAAALWDHGPRMYRRIRMLGRAWPALAGSDAGDLIAFLNSPPERN
jgi:mono/diheme cytochrome c family protein